MNPFAEKSYKTDEKKDFTPEEFTKAKKASEFVIDLTKAISKSGYYDSNHPVSMDVKKGLYGDFKSALGDSAEIMLTCHDYEEKVDIHISGILDEPFNIRKLTQANTSDLFVPKLKDYFERKSLNSFVIKKSITPEHFESFIDVMSEPIADTTDPSKLGEYLTKALIDLDITEVSAVFKNDIVLSRGKLPWRVSIILRRLAKDLKVVPLFRSASTEKMKLIKNQIVEDIIRPLNNNDLFRDLIVNCDILANHITHLMESDELENLVINSLPSDAVVPVSQSVLEVYIAGKDGEKSEDELSAFQKREEYLSKVLNITAQRIIAENMPDITGLFEQLYECKIVTFDMLPEKLRMDIQNKKLAAEVLLQIDTHIERAMKARDIEEMAGIAEIFKRVMPDLIRRREWPVIKRIAETLDDYSPGHQTLSGESWKLSNLPDYVLKGTENEFSDQYINADKDLKKEIHGVLQRMQATCIDVLNVIISKSKEPDILKSVTEILFEKGELARQWSKNIFDDQNQALSMLNIALLVIVKVGQGDDVSSIKKYARHPNASIRLKALNAMARLNEKEAEGAVIEALKDSEEKVRIQAAGLLENELSVSGASASKLLLFIKDRLNKKNLSPADASFISGLLKSLGRIKEDANKDILESEIINIASDLLREKTGILKFIKSEIGKEQMEIASVCLLTLGKTGGPKAREYLKLMSRETGALSKVANEAMAALDKRKD
ncbi:MAG: HEAT repeat domain-containing protein [Smithella sp.]|nr:HEAT repeat domain-containing protein [Smithella sp.]